MNTENNDLHSSGAPLSIRESLRGRKILLTGASGFVGKLWIVQVLFNVPEVGKLYLLIRPRSNMTAAERFVDIVNKNHVFAPLHERYGAGLSRFLTERVQIIQGNVKEENLGLSDDDLTMLRENVDLVVNCAGLTEFNPDPGLSLDTNTLGTLRAAELTRSCKSARMLHISTCYVAGFKSGDIEEELDLETSPNGKAFDAETEYAFIRTEMQRIEERHLGEHQKTEKRRRVKELKRLRDSIDLGKERATRWGFPNIYTYCKSLAERLLALRHSDLDYAILRPAIVESSVSNPLKGWNEGLDGTGPLAFALSRWFRRVPSTPGKPFDVVPVDYVGKAMTIASAALLSGCAHRIYQVGTADINPISIDRATELTGLWHRRNHRLNGESFWERSVLSRWEGRPIQDEPFLSVPNLRDWSRSAGIELQRSPEWFPEFVREFLKQSGRKMEDASRQMRPLEVLLDIYHPFVFGDRQVFKIRALRETKVLEPEFQYDPETIDWHDYWLNTHVPGLNKYCFPRLEGKEPEPYVPEIRFEFETAETPDSLAEGQHS